jgi:hypothetical protein
MENKGEKIFIKLVLSYSLIFSTVMASFMYIMNSYRQGTLADAERFIISVIVVVAVSAAYFAVSIIMDLRKIIKTMEKERETENEAPKAQK